MITEYGRCTNDIKYRIGLASAMFGTMNKIRKSNNITIATKVKIYGACVIPVIMYAYAVVRVRVLMSENKYGRSIQLYMLTTRPPWRMSRIIII